MFLLLKLHLRETRLLLAALLLLGFAFQWLFVWLTSQLEFGAIAAFLDSLPNPWQRLMPLSVAEMAAPAGRVAFGYEHPVVLLACLLWAIGRGSDAVSGPLSRGTLEMLLAQPVRRSTLLVSHVMFTVVGAALLALVCWLGTAAGLTTVEKMRDLSAAWYVLPALNLFAVTFFMAGVTTLVSACDRYRWRTIGIAITFYVVAIVLKVMGLMAPTISWVKYASFLNAFEPQRYLSKSIEPQMFALETTGPLLLLGAVCYSLSLAIFTSRDLPAPL